MDDLSERIRIELENIDRVFNEMPLYSKLPNLSSLELAGVAALLHNFYTGVENIIKQILVSKEVPIPQGASWHKELLEAAVRKKVISIELTDHLIPFLGFRHFFSHAYALDLHSDKMELLVKDSVKTYSLFKDELKKFR